MTTSDGGQTITQTTTTTKKPEERFLQRLSNKYDVPSNPIRCAREYSVPKTACLAPRSRYVFEYCPACRRKPGNPTDHATQRSFSERLRETLARRVTGRGHRQRRE